MRPVSPNFLAALRQSHQIAARCELFFPGRADPVVVPIEDGNVSQDRTAAIRRTGHVEIPWSLDAGEDLGVDLRTLPLGGWARLSRGIRFPDGSVELATLGFLRVESVSWLTVEDRASLELADRMAQVRDEPFTAPYMADGKRAARAAVEIAQQVFGPRIAYRVLYDPDTVFPPNFIYSDARSDAIFSIANSVGAFAFFDAEGDFVFGSNRRSAERTIYGNLTRWSSVITNLAGADLLSVGMSVNGVGLPPGLVIQHIDSPSQVTMNAPVNTWAMKNARSLYGSPVLTMISDTTDLSPGMEVTGPGLPSSGTMLVSVDGPDQITLSNPVMSSSIHWEFFFVFVVHNPVLLTFAGAGGGIGWPVWLVDTGARGVMVNAQEALDRTGIFNGVLVQGQPEADEPPVSALVVDDNPTSPTRWDGPFGKVVRIEQSEVATEAAARVVAESMLDDNLGLTRSITLTVAPNPALEAGDIIDVHFKDGRRERHRIDALTLDLGPSGAQSLSTRSVFTPVEGLLHADKPRVVGFFYGRDAWREAREARRVA